MSASLPDKPDLATKHKSQEMIYQKLKKSKSKHHGKSKSALPDKRTAEKWKSRTSDPSTKDVEELRNRNNGTRKNGTKPLTIKINNHLNKKNGKKKRGKIKSSSSSSSSSKKGGANNNSQQQILGDILIHVSSWNQLIAKNDPNIFAQNKDKKILGVGWKTVYCILDGEKFRFWDDDMMDDEKKNNNNNNMINDEDYDEANVTIYLSEILTINKSIRSIDGEKYIIELTICGLKCLLSFSNIEQREYWHSLLSDYHLNYFIWNTTPLDEKKRTSKNVINGIYKLLNNNHNKKESLDINILYIEEILQRISSLNITKIIDLVPIECKFMSARLSRIIMSIKFFFMSVLKSLSGADIPLPSREILIDYLSQIEKIKWNTVTNEILDFYSDQCYRILFNLSFAFTSNARDEIMKLNKVIDDNNNNNNHNNNNHNNNNNNDIINDQYDKKIAEMKFEYESLQKSWKMHRDRLQEYVMAYRDAVAKLKHSYHQRDNLCKKIETLNQEKKKLNESIQVQTKNHDSMMEQAQQLAHKFSVVSQQMNGYTMNVHMMNNNGGYNNHINGNNNNNNKVQQYQSHLQNLIQQRNDILQTDPTNPALQIVIKQINECQQKITSIQNNGPFID